ncbi:Cerato-platanin-domain-containing protein [Russula emetica]|nr:Cerato-platanin-domain-containing protein [Russula emetica]
MIYFTTFIFTLLLSHIARAVPACGDAASPEDLYDPTYADGQHALPIVVYNVTWSNRYDNKNGDTNKVACSTGPHGLAQRYPHFKDFPDFAYIGGAWNVKWGSQYCGSCWNLTNLKTYKTISVTIIDSAKTGYNISKEAFEKLNGGKVGSGTLQAEAQQVSPHFCGFK